METVVPSSKSLPDRKHQVSADEILGIGRQIVETERRAVAAVAENLGGSFVEAVRLLLDCRGRVAVTGMGKAGLIGRKIQATLSSTATPAYALHPVEAIHGDLGMMLPDDVVLALSNSGETQELVRLLPLFARLGCRTVLVTAKPQSRCAKLADVVINIGDVPEACPLGLAPSSSTTAMLAAGDALALTVMKIKGVRPEQYARFHPGGALGRSLMRVSEIMRVGADCPRLSPSDSLDRYYDVCDQAPRRAGAAAVIDDDNMLVGIFTDGDLRRMHRERKPLSGPIGKMMTAHPKHARQDDLVADALRVMQKHKIDELPAVDADGRLVGMIDVQDLMAHGFSAFDDQ